MDPARACCRAFPRGSAAAVLALVMSLPGLARSDWSSRHSRNKGLHELRSQVILDAGTVEQKTEERPASDVSGFRTALPEERKYLQFEGVSREVGTVCLIRDSWFSSFATDLMSGFSREAALLLVDKNERVSVAILESSSRREIELTLVSGLTPFTCPDGMGGPRTVEGMKSRMKAMEDRLCKSYRNLLQFQSRSEVLANCKESSDHSFCDRCLAR